ncbi:MAG TPA: primosomal protein N' [Candidatus Monoglobus merdigallinarum]|uniref:Replication restart protein PriA n=1 Tax=Candidatus Monoglobus merdigallinarum TaxID=2838698 RepID=A0A9D1PRQ8_9FIRM|nr:primosomal protein N' [Candidatus Monoglobus merdigallinarum]
MIAQVILISSRHIIDKTFDYIIPNELRDTAKTGMRVLVPFGIYNNPVEGLIVGISESSEHMALKRIKSVIGTASVCSEELLGLCFYMQQKYLCSFYSAFKLLVPPKMKLIIKEWITLNASASLGGITPFQKKITDTIAENGGAIEFAHLAELIGSHTLRRSLKTLEEKQIIKISEKAEDSVKELNIRFARLKISVEDAYTAADELKSKRAYIQSDMLLTVADSEKISTSDLIALSDGSYSSLNALVKKDYIELFNERRIRDVYNIDKHPSAAEYTPTPEQQPIIDYTNRLLDTNRHEKILIRGVTGSGKTEVFLQTIKRCIENGRRAIMLVPEISLTPQMVDRFVSRFGNKVAVMHSGLSYGERFDQWNKIKNNEVSVVVGARSAIFAPLENIGLIVIDEEHETSYKSETSPRYHTREIAIYRAEKNNAPLILASATPSVDSYYYASEKKSYKLFEMNSRYNNNKLPEVKIVDMRSELFEYHNLSPISNRLEFEIRKNLDRHEKTILFLNRRGYNTFISCRECGYVVECKNCSIPLTYHLDSNSLTCHYCGYTAQNIKTCPECGSKHIKFFGTGTQKIEAEINKLFPEARILRMDRDTTSGKGSHEQILNAFRNDKADILLGTQMVTKGLDFPDVTLVGVLAADSSLGVDDFRANERTFSLLTQVCGRAGRGDIPGRAVIQTYQPKNSTIEFAKAHNYTGFYKNEINFRKRLNYPPFCDIINILVHGTETESVTAEINSIYSCINASADKNNIIMLSAPMPAPISKIKNNYRYRIFMKVRSSDNMLPVLHEINDRHNTGNSKNTLVIDINPINMS